MTVDRLAHGPPSQPGPSPKSVNATLRAAFAFIVLDGGEGSLRERDNFNFAHQLAHLVTHRGIHHTPGTRTVEAQAHSFAGAFLGPAEAMREVSPRSLDWGCYLELKREFVEDVDHQPVGNVRWRRS